MFAVLQMHGICMDTSLTEPEILSAQNSATVAGSDTSPMVQDWYRIRRSSGSSTTISSDDDGLSSPGLGSGSISSSPGPIGFSSAWILRFCLIRSMLAISACRQDLLSRLPNRDL